MKLALVSSQQKMENTRSSEEQAHYRNRLLKHQASTVLLAHCDESKSRALILLRGSNCAVSLQTSKILPNTKK